MKFVFVSLRCFALFIHRIGLQQFWSDANPARNITIPSMATPIIWVATVSIMKL
jgi:hypothetical protein